MLKKLLGAVCVAGCLAAAPLHAASGAAQPSVLGSRIAPPAADVIAVFESAGMREVRHHVLTPAESVRVEAALAALPALHRAVLAQKLRRLSFVDGIPGQGTGLTSRAGDSGEFDITLRASLLDEPLSAFLTAKEARLFEADGSGVSVKVTASGTDTLSYVLLHEATHVVDGARELSKAPDGRFTAGIWTGRSTLSEQYAGSAAAATPFRRSKLVPAARAAEVYDALARTPFVSLYATAAAPEDLAELVAWHEIAKLPGASLAITLYDAKGTVLRRYEPLAFPAVQARMREISALLAQPVG